jgi:hypothetical protein
MVSKAISYEPSVSVLLGAGGGGGASDNPELVVVSAFDSGSGVPRAPLSRAICTSSSESYLAARLMT